MMLALCTAVTFLRPCLSAYSKAYSTMRRVPVTEMGLMEMPESGRMEPAPLSSTNSMSRRASSLPSSNSMPAERSSEFSRTMTRSTSS